MPIYANCQNICIEIFKGVCDVIPLFFFSLDRAVRRGSALAAKLYLIYKLSTSEEGDVMLDFIVDIALISPTLSDMQGMLDIVTVTVLNASLSVHQVDLIFSKRTKTYGELNQLKI